MAFVAPARHLLRAKDLADARYVEPLDVDDLARAAGLSRAHFSREFRRAFGESPHAYLLTRRLERARLGPLGFVANDYGLAVFGNGDITAEAHREPGFIDDLFAEDMLGDDLEDWLAEAALMKRTFRSCAIIAGLIERRFPGQEKTRKQVTISTDLVYNVLRRYEPDHILLRAARADAATGLLDVRRLGVMLARIRGRIIHKALDRVSPLSVALILEIGRERVFGEAADEILAEAEAMLMDEATA